MNGVLNIYKASAGSGKTYTLTEQYIKMLLDASLHGKDYFKRVLAVTFTNKATDEMKTRIVEKLYNISKEEKAVKVADVILEPARAKELLTAILHGYSFFRITTIDKFFQQIIRSFVREIGLSGNYSIELDEKRIIKDTIADILINIGDKDHKLFLNWFREHMITDAGAGESVTFNSLKSKLEDISSQIFKEQYMALKGIIPDNNTINSVQKSLTARRKKISDTFKAKAQSIMSRLNSEPEIESNCKRGAFTPISEVLSNDQFKFPTFKPVFLNWLNEPQVAKTNKHKAEVEAAYNSWILNMVSDFINYAQTSECEYHTCDVILRNLPYLKLFNAIDCEVERYMKETNTQLLVKSGVLINDIIDGSDTPFIYEKTGTYINNFLIDEFQDTSRIQWDNFIPLIKNSLSEGHSNLVVGDVKQSIYRFRDSDWSILGKDVQKRFAGSCEVHNLSTSRRSLKNIVEFNNRIFTNAASYLQQSYNAFSGRTDDTIANAYSDVRQFIHKDGSGYVEINFQASDEEKDDRFQVILEKIKELQERGYRLKDIGILVKTNKEGSAIARHLLENGVNVVSEEALRIASSPAVSDVISVLSHIANPFDTANSYLVNNLINKDKRLEFSQLEHLPLYEMVEQIIFMLGLDKVSSNIPYLNAFKDLVLDYANRQNSVLQSFLEYWSEVKDGKSLTTISESDSVNIITIHKSKGLAYKVVLIPEINWDLRNSNHVSILWEKIPDNITDADYKKLGCVPLQYKPELAKSIFKESYFDELLLEYIDNLNDLYVAFTRAEDVLIGYCSTPKKDSTCKNAENKALSSMLPIFYAGTGRDAENKDYSQITLGELSEHDEEQKKSNSDTNPQCTSDNGDNEISPVEKMNTFNLRGTEYIPPETERGNRMHRIMEKINTYADLDPVLQDMLFKGYITETQQQELKTDLTSYILNPHAASWFNGEYNLLNERSIIDVFTTSDGTKERRLQRPDRVMIDAKTGAVTIVDYKFGEEKQLKHVSQVRNYINLYNKAGCSNVTGYIYYFDGFEIIKV